jgi:hypothetical protein
MPLVCEIIGGACGKNTVNIYLLFIDMKTVKGNFRASYLSSLGIESQSKITFWETFMQENEQGVKFHVVLSLIYKIC